jgi:hypothetical protein
MRGPDATLVQRLVSEEIQRRVQDAVNDRECLHSGRLARLMSRTYPNCGMSVDEISDAIVREAIRAGAAIELSRAGPPLMGKAS